jgi:hypothetical protein
MKHARTCVPRRAPHGPFLALNSPWIRTNAGGRWIAGMRLPGLRRAAAWDLDRASGYSEGKRRVDGLVQSFSVDVVSVRSAA